MFEKLFTQRLFADNVGHRLERFKIQSYSPYRANFRCPICGDSQKNKYRARAYFIEKDKGLIFYCHNECGSMSFDYFLKDYYGDIYSSYRFDLLRNMRGEKYTDIDEEETIAPETTIKLTSDISLITARSTPIGMDYLMSRKIPEQFYNDIYITNKFHSYVNSILVDKFPEGVVEKEEMRLVFPMRAYNKKIFGVISRSLDPSAESRYLTIKFDEDSPKFFGLDRMDRDKEVRIVEGPIDSFFVDNCIALGGTDGNPDTIFSSKKNYVMILDNQPRSESVIRKYEMYIARGCKMFIWPHYINEKDINDVILNTIITQEDLEQIIKENTFTDLKLKIKFNDWRRI